MERPSCSKVPRGLGSRILRAQSPPLHRCDQLAPWTKQRHYMLSGGSDKLERVGVPKAPKGPALSSPSADGFQPAEGSVRLCRPGLRKASGFPAGAGASVLLRAGWKAEPSSLRGGGFSGHTPYGKAKPFRTSGGGAAGRRGERPGQSQTMSLVRPDAIGPGRVVNSKGAAEASGKETSSPYRNSL